MSDILLYQTADADRFFPMISATMQCNRAFCLRRDVRMEVFIGVRRGIHPWQATYNRLGMLGDLLARDYDGWLIYLDADAFVPSPRFEIRGFLKQHADSAMIHPVGGGKGPWDVNAGVFLWNFARPETREVARRWIAAFEQVTDQQLRNAADPVFLMNDQTMLHAVLRDAPELTACVALEAHDVIGYPHSRLIKQFVPNGQQTLEERTARIVEAVEQARRRSGAAAAQGADQVRRSAMALIDAPQDVLEAHLPRHEAAALGQAMAQLLRHHPVSDGFA
ncbi:hypothetical protein [Falsiroseomonas sp. E2-1-a20]|uniref:hypothetical protein n=1 Tax=Falsiroseomonas sp. E2-1-a20 TaxID=3239300 RepID=UPI003F41401C